MKRVINLIAIIIVLTLVSAIIASSFTAYKIKTEKPDFKMAVISDMHVMAEAQILDATNEEYIDFIYNRNRMIDFSEAILKSTIDHIIDGGVDTLLVTGDLADQGTRLAHEAIAAQFLRAKNAGIDVYVVVGNHDVDNHGYIYSSEGTTRAEGISEAEFAEIYGDFGFNNALLHDDKTLSYTIDINDEYRLIALDANNMSAELLDWAKIQIEKCKSDGKTPIGACHIPVLSHFGEFVGEMDIGGMRLETGDEIKKVFTLAGLEILFTGHLHSQDIVSYTDENGTLYDIETGCLAECAMPIRIFESFSKKINIHTERVQTMPEKYFADYFTEKQKATIRESLEKFAYVYTEEDFMPTIFSKIKEDALPSVVELFGIDGVEHPELINDIFDNIIYKFIYSPIYKKDEGLGKISIERICEWYGVTLPESRYTSVANFIIACVKQIYCGDEKITVDSVEGIIFRYTLYSAFYFLDDYDLFGKLGEYNEDIPSIDLSELVRKLFEEQVLDITSDNFISKIVMIFKDKLPININVTANSDPIVLVRLFKNIFSSYELNGIAIGDYIDSDNGIIDMGKILDEVLWGKIGSGVLYDDGPKDNEITISKSGEKIKKYLFF